MKIKILIQQQVDTDDFEFDDPINIDNNINYLVGSKNNVLERYYLAAKKYKIKITFQNIR